MGKKIERLGITKEKGWLYYAKNKGGRLAVYRSKMNRGGGKMSSPKREELKVTRITPDYDKYIYYVDGDGDLARAPRAGQ
ncbi:MAG: hypothetical protein MAG715_01089 [Methanonatronarchaeales archaeon]|nr:hypothetical protein [Methanonatronarchaeales archaeon]